MPLDIKALVQQRLGENYQLHEKYVNRTLVKTLRTIDFDKVYARAEGCYLYDREGRDYLDFLSGYGVFGLGRNHPKIKQVIRDILDLDLPNMVQLDCALLSGLLAEALCQRTAPHLDAVFFCNSGTEAVEGALKFARAATGRPRLLSLEHAYHGLSYGSLSITVNKNFQEGFGPFLPGAGQVKFDDLEGLERELSRRDVAAFIFEPVQGKGVFIPDRRFLQGAQTLCRKYGTLFIADEVQTGLGRTGKLFGYQHDNLEPDIVTLAKTLSGGFVPVGAFLTRRSIHQAVFSKMERCVVHSTTFGRNNLAMSCGLATLHILEEENLIANVERRGQQLAAALREIAKKHDCIQEIRQRGLMLAVQFREPGSFQGKMAWKAFKAMDPNLFTQMVVTALMQRHRILSHVAAHGSDALKILPPFIVGDPEIERFVHGLDDVLSDAEKWDGPFFEFGKNVVKKALQPV